MIATILDYGVGNLHSLAKSLAGLGLRVRISADVRAAVKSELLVLPGVGAFDAAALQLASAREDLCDALGSGLPCLAICLGMQLLLDRSEEGDAQGLGFIPGRVRKLRTSRVPHMGWNSLEPGGTPIDSEGPMYFAHSFACEPDDTSLVAAWTCVDSDRFPAVATRARTTAVQFHPEKSGAAGRAFLRTWLGGLWD